PWRSTMARLLTPLPRRVGPMSSPPPFAEANVASMKLSRSSIAPSSRNVLANWVRDVAQDLAFAPRLKAAMPRFVIGIARRQQVPLRAGVQNPQHGFQDRAGGHRLAARTTVRDVFLGNRVPNPFPLVVAQSKHARPYTYLS